MVRNPFGSGSMRLWEAMRTTHTQVSCAPVCELASATVCFWCLLYCACDVYSAGLVCCAQCIPPAADTKLAHTAGRCGVC
jgi:hypothetical protein